MLWVESCYQEPFHRLIHNCSERECFLWHVVQKGNVTVSTFFGGDLQEGGGHHQVTLQAGPHGNTSEGG